MKDTMKDTMKSSMKGTMRRALILLSIAILPVVAACQRGADGRSQQPGEQGAEQPTTGARGAGGTGGGPTPSGAPSESGIQPIPTPTGGTGGGPMDEATDGGADASAPDGGTGAPDAIGGTGGGPSEGAMKVR